MADVVVQDLVRRFGAITALNGVSFDVREGEFLTLLGPSGCGKSTMLAALAGLDRPTLGRITIGGRTVFDSATDVYIDAQFRGLGMMFQSYALWPHMTVEQNLAFPLRLRGIRGAEARRKIEETLELVAMASYIDRYPGELSGGQQQRVALARTLVYSPPILLLDEPLSNLDAKLRDRARVWLRELQRRTGVTTIYVTHDQSEALGLSDRIVVMSEGSIAQIGTPRQIYDAPVNVFVADFVGSTNLIDVDLVGRTEAGCSVRLRSGTVMQVASPPADGNGSRIVASIRPERIEIVDDTVAPNTIAGKIVSSEFQGGENVLTVDAGGDTLRVETKRDLPLGPVALHFPPDALRTLAGRKDAAPT